MSEWTPKRHTIIQVGGTIFYTDYHILPYPYFKLARNTQNWDKYSSKERNSKHELPKTVLMKAARDKIK